MNAKEIRGALEAAGLEIDDGPDAATIWIVAPASDSEVRFAMVIEEHRVELAFRFGRLGEIDRDSLLDLLFLNHETNHFRVAVTKRRELCLFSTWPLADLDSKLLTLLVEQFAITCEQINEDVADVVAGTR